MEALNKLKPEDIDEKIRLNEQDGIDIFKLRDNIKEELKDFQWYALRSQIQCQCYTEQLEHIEKRIAEMKNESVTKILETAEGTIGDGLR